MSGTTIPTTSPITTPTTPAAGATGASAPADAGLTLTDIANAVNVIDFACDQGAFKGWQAIETVQVVRRRLANFVASANQVGLIPAVSPDPGPASGPLTNPPDSVAPVAPVAPVVTATTTPGTTPTTS